MFDGTNGALLHVLPAVGSTPKAVRDVLLGLHEGLYAGPLLRGLYVLSGLMGAAMIATGLVLWAVKRRQRAAKAGRVHGGLWLVERLNVGGVIINDVPTFRVDHMPYGGNKNSGIGREGPRFAIEDMTTLKMVVITP